VNDQHKRPRNLRVLHSVRKLPNHFEDRDRPELYESEKRFEIFIILIYDIFVIIYVVIKIPFIKTALAKIFRFSFQ